MKPLVFSILLVALPVGLVFLLIRAMPDQNPGVRASVPLSIQPVELPPDGVKLAVRGDERRARAKRQSREQSRDQFVRVLAERDVARWVIQKTTEARPHE